MITSISIAMCSFNGANWIADQLNSIAAQTKKPDELIICDDGSTDSTLEIIQKFADDNPAIHVEVHTNQTNHPLGPQQNFAKAISLCKGQLIFLCDQDDIWLPNKLLFMSNWMYQHPNVDGIFSNGWLIDENGIALNETMWDALYFEKPLQETTNTNNLLQYLLLNGNIVTGTACCIRKDTTDRILPIPDIHGLWHDHWIALVLSAEAKLFFITDELLYYRIHSTQQVGFPGRQRAFSSFRDAIHSTWLNPSKIDDDGTITSHTAWGVQAWERYTPLLTERIFNDTHLRQTGKQLSTRLTEAKTLWLYQLAWRKRKIKMLKHWLKGGEYLRISFKDLISI